MDCSSCGRVNRAGARFCGGCGKPLAAHCPACGADTEADARFCDGCGAALGARPADEAVARKVVSIVFADLVGSTSLHERLDAESTRRLMDRYYRTLHAVVEEHGGTVVKLLGDGVMAAFGVPRVAEDDAIRAVRAAVAVVEQVSRLGSQVLGPDPRHPTPDTPLSVRVAVNTGEVVVSADQHDFVGDPVNIAARLQQEAGAGDVLIGESTRRLVSELVTLAPLGALSLKGRSETVTAYRVVSLDRPAGTTATPFIGRDGELRRVVAAYDAALAECRAHLAVIVGSPGLGKSRLMAEFTRRVAPGTTILTARCDAAAGTTFAPLAEALRNFLHIDDGASGEALRTAIEAALQPGETDRPRIAEGISALLAGAPATAEETFFVVRRFFAALAAIQPVVLVIDDLHWAEPLLLDLTEHLVQWGAGVRLLVLAAARPELREVRASLAVAGGVVHAVVTLTGLDAGAATRLAATVIGASELPAAVAGRVLATSEGNPLFLSELVRMLVEDGVLRREADRWVAAVDLAEIEVPPTIQALLAARIERLRPEERAVLERAAVIGRQFSHAAVVHLLPPELRAGVDARLESLRRSELIEPDAGWFLGEPALRFHHALIRDAAYRRLLKGTRAEFHGRFAGWIETRVAETGEHDEMIGWHLEQAHRHLQELGPVDETGRAVGERAARYLAAAGRRALARDDLAPAASLLGRALARLDGDDPGRADLALDWCEALLAAGDVGPVGRALEELERFSGNSSRWRAWHTCFAGQLAVLTDPQALHGTAEALADAAEALAAAGDAAGEAKAHSVHALALARLGKIGACEAALDRALAAARRGGDRRRANAVLAGAPVAALWGPSPVTRASGRCLDVVRVLRITQGAPAVEAVALRCQAVLEALRGRTDAARRMITSSRRMVEELGITQRLLEADMFSGLIELLDSNAAAAEPCLRSAYDGLRSRGLGIDAAQAAALLGRALLAQSRVAEAEALSHESEALAGDDIKAAIAWRGVRAQALAQRGEHATALELARAAVAIAAATDALLDHADARLALATALRAAGRHAEAAGEEARAIELWQVKGATLLVRGKDAELPQNAAAAALGNGRERDGVHSWCDVGLRVLPNAATTAAARMPILLAARDADALERAFADLAEVVDHPNGTVLDRRGMLTAWRSLLRAQDPLLRTEPLATLGDALALCRSSMAFGALAEDDVAPFGAVCREEIVLVEVNRDGQQRRNELFDPSHLGDAVARLYERHAELLPEGNERACAAGTARSVAVLMEPPNLDHLRTVFAPDVEFADHRTLGFAPLRGAQAMLRAFRSLFEVADAVTVRVDDVLGLRRDALLVRWTTAGTDRATGGPYEKQFLLLLVFGTDGLVTRSEQFDADREDEALACFDALPGRPTTTPHLENAATRTLERGRQAWAAAAWERFTALFAPRFHHSDRRALVHLELDRDRYLESIRPFFEAATAAPVIDVLATRGDRLLLVKTIVHVAAAISNLTGPSELEFLGVIEVDEHGDHVAMIQFDAGDLDGAYAELDARYAAEAADSRRAALTRMFTQAFAARDWDALAAVLAPDLVVNDHRLLGWETLHGPAAYIQAVKQLVDLSPDVQLRVDHLTMSGPRFLYFTTWLGTHEGGAFESPSAIVCELDAMGRIRRFDQYDLDQLEAAKALCAAGVANESTKRTQAHRSGDPLHIPPNAAMRTLGRIGEPFRAQDWSAIHALTCPDFRFDDRRRRALVSGNADLWIKNLEVVRTYPGLQTKFELIGTAGDRIALERISYSGGPEDGGFEGEFLRLSEVDADGALRAVIHLDSNERRAAFEEALARFAAGEAAGCRAHVVINAFGYAIARHEWDGLRRYFADGLLCRDRRRLSFGEIPCDKWIESLRVLSNLGPDVGGEPLQILTWNDCGRVGVIRQFGTTREGGAFESVFVPVFVVHDDRIVAFEIFDVGDADEAVARFPELCAALA